MIDRLIKALSEQDPSWYITLADPRDLAEFVKDTSSTNSFFAARLSPEAAAEHLQLRTAERLFIVIRAAVHAGLVASADSHQPKQVQVDTYRFEN